MTKQPVRILALAIFFCSINWVYGISDSKQKILDSLNYRLENSTDPCDKAYTLVEMSEILYFVEPDTIIDICEQAVAIVPESSLDTTCLKSLASAHNNLGIIADDHGRILDALEHYELSLEIYEKMGNQDGIGTALTNIAYVYKNLDDYSQCLGYNRRALNIRILRRDSIKIAKSLNNIGFIYHHLGNRDSCIYYYEKSKVIRKQIGDMRGYAFSLNNTGVILKEQGRYMEAAAYYHECIEIFRKLGSDKSKITAFTNWGELLYLEGKYSQALECADSAYLFAVRYDLTEKMKNAAQLYSKLYEKMGNYPKALEMEREYHRMKDSINNVTSQKAMTKQQTRYQYVQEKMEMEKEILYEHHEMEKQRIISFGVGLVLLLVAAFVAFLVNRLRLVNRQSTVIEEKNNEIMSSLNYAKRIQYSLFRKAESNSFASLPHFIYYSPKDIVSGDFYWTHQINDFIYIAVADCTGHGVPGAFLTMLGTRILNQISGKNESLSPSQILEELRSEIIADLSQFGDLEDSTDGMDISLLKLNVKDLSAEWAGAMNPLFIISSKNNVLIQENDNIKLRLENDLSRLIEYKGDNQPIAYSDYSAPFLNHKIQFSEGDLVYLFTDGYADQFGGAEGRRFTMKKFRQILFTASKLSMKEQRAELIRVLQNWKGEKYEDQIDDICILGFEVRKM